MSRLRLINGVTRVTLSSAVRSGSSITGSAVATPSAGSSGCKSDSANFDVVVFFQPPPGAATPSASTTAGQPAASTTSSGTPTSTTTSTTSTSATTTGGSQ